MSDPGTPGRDGRDEVLQTFGTQIYGRAPEVDVGLSWSVLEEGRTEDGRHRRQLALTFTGPRDSATMMLLVYLPSGSTAQAAGSSPVMQPVPAFLGLNFQGNHACSTDPGVIRAGTDLPESRTGPVFYDELGANYPVPPPRGNNAAAWPAHLANERGYAVITAHYLQTGPDHPDIFHRGLFPIFGHASLRDRPGDAWGAISMWAWVLRRILDGLADGLVPEVDPQQVWAMGHSRLGKAALWAAAQDERFAGVISNNSGRMGAALTRPVGEDLPTMVRVFPHWFAPNFLRRVEAGEPVPVDQDRLLACLAPRPLYVASASEDHHADPEGEFAALRAAAPAWQPGADAARRATTAAGRALDGPVPAAAGSERDGRRTPPGDTPSAAFPEPGEGLVFPGLPLGYHLRAGEHAVHPFDWERWLDFRDDLARPTGPGHGG
mgnify:CR=1 FL=1